MEEQVMLDVKKLKKFRETRGWSQEQFASAAGISVRTVQRVERDGVASRETKVCLAAALDVPHADLELPVASSPLIDKIASRLDVAALVHRTIGTTFLMIGLGFFGAAMLIEYSSTTVYLGGFFGICGIVDLWLAVASKRRTETGANSVA